MLHGHLPSRHTIRSHGVLIKNLVRRRTLLTLAIETSCDDTCVAILEKKSQLDNPSCTTVTTAARLYFHEKITARNSGHGGIHPLEALQSHHSNLANLVSRSFKFLPNANATATPGRTIVVENGITKQKPDFIAVTRGPGMRSNLSCGMNTAKGLAIAWQIPLVGVHHMQAHALTPRLVHALEENIGTGHGCKTPVFPFLTLLVSGGHTMLLRSTNLTEHAILATTADTAIGDALDKCGRLLLPDSVKTGATDTAFGKYLSHYAFPDASTFSTWRVPRRRAEEIQKLPNKFGWSIQAPFSDTREMNFSFTSIVSQAEQIFDRRTNVSEGGLSDEENLLLARTVLGTAFEHLGSRVVIGLEALRGKNIEIPTLVVSGGVAANDFLRHFLRSLLDIRGFEHVRLIFPPVDLCTDNAAMIAWAGMEMYEAGYQSKLDVDSIRRWSMDSASDDGGILGVGGWMQTAS